MKNAFLDTSVLLAGLIELRGPREAAQRVMTAVADGAITQAKTAWHCCLEFYAVSTRLPEEFRLSPEDSVTLIEQEILDRLEICELPADARRPFLRNAVDDRAAGGRIYDAHIAEIARISKVALVVTENVRHFTALRSRGTEILTSEELAARLVPRP